MIRISILYPSVPGGRFDHAYYETVHIPMVLELLGPAIGGVSVERGVAAGPPWPDPPFVAAAHFLCESPQAYMAALAPHAARLQADLANYSDIAPVLQVGEVTVSRG